MKDKTICLLFQIRCKAVEWHPDVATQMVLASEDDRYPVIQVCSNFNAIKLILDAVLKMQFSNKHLSRGQKYLVFFIFCSSPAHPVGVGYCLGASLSQLSADICRLVNVQVDYFS